MTWDKFQLEVCGSWGLEGSGCHSSGRVLGYRTFLINNRHETTITLPPDSQYEFDVPYFDDYIPKNFGPVP